MILMIFTPPAAAAGVRGRLGARRADGHHVGDAEACPCGEEGGESLVLHAFEAAVAMGSRLVAIPDRPPGPVDELRVRSVPSQCAQANKASIGERSIHHACIPRLHRCGVEIGHREVELSEMHQAQLRALGYVGGREFKEKGPQLPQNPAAQP